MKRLVAALLLIGCALALPSFAGRAEAASPWVGHWTIIHLAPSLPLGRMNIKPDGRHFKLRIHDVQDHVFCPGHPVKAKGEGHLTDPTHMVANFHFRCLDTGAEGNMTLHFLLNLTNPNGIYEIAELPGTGRVWTRPAP